MRELYISPTSVNSLNWFNWIINKSYILKKRKSWSSLQNCSEEMWSWTRTLRCLLKKQNKTHWNTRESVEHVSLQVFFQKGEIIGVIVGIGVVFDLHFSLEIRVCGSLMWEMLVEPSLKHRIKTHQHSRCRFTSLYTHCARGERRTKTKLNPEPMFERVWKPWFGRTTTLKTWIEFIPNDRARQRAF